MILTTKGGKETEMKNDSTSIFEKQVCTLTELWDVGQVTSVSGPCSMSAAGKRFSMIFKSPPSSVTLSAYSVLNAP